MGLEESKTLGNFVIGKKVLGRGGFGKVFRGKHKTSGEYVAIKELNSLGDLGKKGNMGMDEIKKLQLISNHKHIVQLLDYFFRNQSFWIVMEYCDVGDLDRYMREYRPRIEGIVKMVHQCSSAVTYLHNLSPKVVHRDIKPGNLLIKCQNEKHVLKLADFGISKVLEEEPGVTMHMTVAGTEIYLAPEVIAQTKYDEKVDVFAMGLLFLGMLKFNVTDKRIIVLQDEQVVSGQLKSVGKVLYEAHLRGTDMPDVVPSSTLDDKHVQQCKLLIRQMLSFQASDRPCAETVCQKTQTIVCPDAEDWDTDVTVEDFSDLDELSSSGEEEIPEDKDDQLKRRLLQAVKAANKDEESDDSDTPDSTNDDQYQFRRGHRVIVAEDEEHVKTELKDHGGWVSKMKKYLGCAGYVRKVSTSAVCVIFDDGDWYWYSPTVLQKVTTPHSEPETWLSRLEIKRGDLVRVKRSLTEQEFEKLQSLHGKWSSDMKKYINVRAIMTAYKTPSLCYVEYARLDNQDIAVDCLEKVTKHGELVKEGDFVTIIPDRDLAKTLQYGHGGWVSPMEKDLGKAGIVVNVGGHDRAQVKVTKKRKAFVWNMTSLKLLARKART